MYNRLLLLSLVFLTACNAILSSPPPDSGIEGRVYVGPMCPVVQFGTDCPDSPYQAALTVLSLEGRKILQFQTDETGRFKVPLGPGEYILHPESPNGIPFATEQTFTVRSGHFTEVIITYDSGIR